MTVQITAAGSIISVVTPHPNVNFNKTAKDLAGLWSADRRAWQFDRRNESLVRAALKRSYGTDGTSAADLVSVQMTIEREEWKGPVVVAGRVICRAYGRDGGASLGAGIVKIAGVVKSGGSRINWRSIADGVFVMHDVPRRIAQRLYDNGYVGVTSASEFDPDSLTDADFNAEAD